MARKSYRGGRIGEEIRRIISDLLLREIKDPRLTGSLVSVSEVSAAADGTFATVYVTMLGSSADAEAAEEEKKEVLAAFESAKGLIRREIGARLQMRYTPELRFAFDTSEEYGRHIERIMSDIGMKPAGRNGSHSPKQIAEALTEAQRIHIFPHEKPDGDTLGSAVALCLLLRELGKDALVVLDDKIPENIAFIENGCVAADFSALPAPDLSVLVDVAETHRLGAREVAFASGTRTLCIDHHVSGKPDFDYNLTDEDAAASAELVYAVAEHLGPLSVAAAEALYVGIITDTGRFCYSNTTAGTHDITADLIEIGVEPSKVATLVYDSVRPEKIRLETMVLAGMEMFAGGKAVLAFMSRQMLADAGALDEETEGIAEKLRGMAGVDTSCFVRETAEGTIKASMRSKGLVNVAQLAEGFGGGGHIRAAGFTTDMPAAAVMDALREKVAAALA